MKCYYYLLPNIFNNQIYSGILESISFEDQEIQKLLKFTEKLKNLKGIEDINNDFKNPDDLKPKS